MRLEKLVPGTLTRRFALVAAALSAVALVVSVAASLWLVERQHAQLLQQLQHKQVESHAQQISASLKNLTERMAEVSRSSLLATGLVDSAGRETYLAPFLNSIRQVGGLPVQVLFADFEGQEVATNGRVSFSQKQREWMVRNVEQGQPNAAIFEEAGNAELVAIQPLSYSRTASPEGALLYKLKVEHLLPVSGARLLWDGAASVAPARPGIVVALQPPPILSSLKLRLFEEASILPVGPSLLPQYGMVVLIALLLAGGVLWLGARLAVKLTADLTRLESFSRAVIENPGGTSRAEEVGSEEVRSLARSVNRMLATLYEQRDLLQRETDKLHQLANTMPQLAWIANPDGRIHWFNDRCYEYSGLGRGEEGRWESVHHPAHLALVRSRWLHSVRTGTPFEMTFPLRSASGEYRTFFTRAAPLFDADGRIVQWFGTNTDVTSLEQAEQAVRESRERLKEGMQAARMAVWDWDIASDKLVFAENAQGIFGVRWSTTTEFSQDVHPEDLKLLRAARAKAIAERSQYRQVVRLKQSTPTGVLWLELRGKVLSNAAGQAYLVRGITLDVTERRSAEERLREADRRKDEFLAMLAHELRNPLAPIANAAELLGRVRLNEKQLINTSAVIARQAQHMTRLIDDLLDVSRVTRGLVALDIQPLDANEIIDAALEQVRTLIESRRHRIDVQRAAPGSVIWGDHTRMVQVLANLLNNAAKYTPPGGLIQLIATASEGQMQISVRDNGNGIPESLRPHLFELFAQGERSPDRSQGGLGLGLALVKSLVSLHGGTVEVHSEGVGKGSEFLLRLPGALQRVTPSNLSSDTGKAVTAEPSAPALKVLVVDDNQDAAGTVAALIAIDGHEVRVHHDAGSALSEVAHWMPQVCILDIGLPDMDGYQLARKIREIPSMQNSLLIALSGYGQQRDVNRSSDAGFDHHMVKPANMRQILSLLRENGNRFSAALPP